MLTNVLAIIAVAVSLVLGLVYMVALLRVSTGRNNHGDVWLLSTGACALVLVLGGIATVQLSWYIGAQEYLDAGLPLAVLVSLVAQLITMGRVAIFYDDTWHRDAWPIVMYSTMFPVLFLETFLIFPS